MDWNNFARDVHQVVVDHGFYEKPPSFTAMVVMFHSELSEAVEECRMGRPMLYHPCNAGGVCEDDLSLNERRDCGNRVLDPSHPEIPCKAKSKKPCGVAVEMADCILRILDTLTEAGVDIDAEIGSAQGEDDTLQAIAKAHKQISMAFAAATGGADMKKAYTHLIMCIEIIMAWAKRKSIPMEAVLQIKHEYNKTRPYRHGGKLM